MSNKFQRRLEEVMSLIPCPVSGCWCLHGAETSYYYDQGCECHVLEVWPVAVNEAVVGETNDQEEKEPGVLFELAEFEFTELIKKVPLEHFHFSQRLAVFEIGWNEFGQDMELRVHLQPEDVAEDV
jgi:hypothetical protein